jgi:hypothetical protein
MSLWVEKTTMWWTIAHNRCGEAVLRDAATAYKVDVDAPNAKRPLKHMLFEGGELCLTTLS